MTENDRKSLYSFSVRRLAPSQLTPESVSYAALLMRGLEWVVIVNDICGSPFNPTDLLPSLFFDGKVDLCGV